MGSKDRVTVTSDAKQRKAAAALLTIFSSFRFLLEFNLYSWWHSDLTAKGESLEYLLLTLVLIVYLNNGVTF